jgi:hypothetical protein
LVGADAAPDRSEVDLDQSTWCEWALGGPVPSVERGGPAAIATRAAVAARVSPESAALGHAGERGADD